MQKISRVGIVCALRQEAKGIIDALALQESAQPDPHFPTQFFSGRSHGAEICLAVAGVDPRYETDNVGTNAAVISSYLLIQQFRPDLLINPGTAGAFRARGAAIGEVYVGQGVLLFHDRRTSVVKYHQYCVGHYPVLPAAKLAKALALRSGVVSTGNSFDCSEDDRLRMVETQTDLKDMEAAAIGWVAWTKGIPLLPVKAVTDLVDDPESAETQFNRNWAHACQNLAIQTGRIVEFVSGRNSQDL